MWCSNCPNFDTCEDPAKLGGGCDIDGADDFGVDPVEDYGGRVMDLEQIKERLAKMTALAERGKEVRRGD